MISVTVIALGKLKESYMRDFCAEYEKRLKAFCKINITELSPWEASFPAIPSWTRIFTTNWRRA